MDPKKIRKKCCAYEHAYAQQNFRFFWVGIPFRVNVDYILWIANVCEFLNMSNIYLITTVVHLFIKPPFIAKDVKSPRFLVIAIVISVSISSRRAKISK